MALACGLAPAADHHGDRDRRADHAVAVAGPAGGWRAEPPQRQDEADGGEQVAQRGEVGAHPRRPSARFLNMASIRSVTAKPPKMFTEARTTARKPNTAATPPAPVAIRGADDDHRADRVGDRHQGVCRASVTDQTT